MGNSPSAFAIGLRPRGKQVRARSPTAYVDVDRALCALGKGHDHRKGGLAWPSSIPGRAQPSAYGPVLSPPCAGTEDNAGQGRPLADGASQNRRGGPAHTSDQQREARHVMHVMGSHTGRHVRVPARDGVSGNPTAAAPAPDTATWRRDRARPVRGRARRRSPRTDTAGP